MKKLILFAATAIIGALLGAVIYKEKKRKQQEARAEGKHVPYGPYETCIKRPLDFILSLVALIILSPVLLFTAILVKIKLGSPVIFTQERPGKDEKVFKLYKFRSMSDARDENGELLPDEVRLTKFGKVLRSTSLDELPELYNILKGDMAVVGNRPLLVEYLPRYNEKQKHRHDVKPGLTSLSASKQRNLASWDEKFEDDVKYVEKITFWGDIKIILDTVAIVFKRKGISSKTSVTMEVFTGNEKAK